MKRVEGIQSEIIAQDGDTVTLKLYDKIDVQQAKARAVDGRYLTFLDFYEKDKITDLQRKHYFALVGDFAEFTGYPTQQADSFFKDYFMRAYELDDWPSLSRGAMKKSTASELLSFVIEFMVANDIPFRKQQFYLTTDISKMLYAMTMKRLCLICGEPHAQAHHATNLVGRGRNRKTHDHWNSTFMTLCTEHHNEVHNLGLTEFMAKYYVKPVKLTKNQLKELGVM